jgi:NADH-quinone oxidoreductase subunit B
MPRPEAIFIAITHLWTMIDKDMAIGYKKYREKYKYYRENQEKALGKLAWPSLFPKGDGNE